MLINIATTIRQHSVRFIVIVAQIHGDSVWAQRVSEAYLQATENLKRKIFIMPPPEYQLGPGKLLRLQKPLYGLRYSGDYRHNSLTRHWKKYLGINPTTGDLSLYSKKSGDKLVGIIGSYDDDTILTGALWF